jgi:hypothetical protein
MKPDRDFFESVFRDWFDTVLSKQFLEYTELARYLGMSRQETVQTIVTLLPWRQQEIYASIYHYTVQAIKKHGTEKTHRQRDTNQETSPRQ